MPSALRTRISCRADRDHHEPGRSTTTGERGWNDRSRSSKHGVRGHRLHGLATRVRWLEFTVEGIFLPFDREATPELEFETNLVWLPAERTRGWVSSHLDVVDKFSEAERPNDRRAYTHKLNFELDTAVAIFNWLPEGRWLRGVELEGSLDHVATGLPRKGDAVNGVRFLDKASPWSFSIVFVLPVAPL
ncbi:MAG: hypothetical protein LC753_08940 [Acidobacteria bacterium]|nr:hypothetical protein [Acidobacteriota bacterium]MCA1650388.1 hypothetical protein [Acidobacteriota bacterium]